MTINDSLRAAVTKLSRSLSSEPQAWAEAERLMARVWKQNHEWVITHSRDEMPATKCRVFDAFVRRRLRYEPMAYLLGETEFCGRMFFADKRALIPRPETEEMIDILASSFQSPQACGIPPKDGLPSSLILDVGTGSGAIAVTLALAYPNATVIATDTSRPALALARKNASRHHARIRFLQANLLSPSVIQTLHALSRAESRDTRYTLHIPLVILANLPYLPLSDKKSLAPDVVKFEPSSALFAKHHGTDLNLKLLSQLAAFQEKETHPLFLLFEHDPPQADILARGAHQLFPDARVAILRDSCGRKRFLRLLSSTQIS